MTVEQCAQPERPAPSVLHNHRQSTSSHLQLKYKLHFTTREPPVVTLYILTNKPKHGQLHIFKESALRPILSISRDVRVSVCLCVCPLPMRFFFEASHWPSDYMIRSRPLIGRPPPYVDRPFGRLWNV